MSPTTAHSTTPADPSPADAEASWRAAGTAWGHAAADWATLFEPHTRDAVEAVFAATGVRQGTDLLDVACGAGTALARAARLGARCTGLDASDELLAIALLRVPDAELVTGSLFALPFADASFDVVTSFNGIWGGCEEGIREIARVLRPGGAAAITFWGHPRRLDLRPYFAFLAETDEDTRDELRGTNRIGVPGEAERMFAQAGLDVVARGTTDSVLEWADDDTAWRALRSPGVVEPVLQWIGEDALRSAALDALARNRSPAGTWHLRNEVVHVVARRP